MGTIVQRDEVFEKAPCILSLLRQCDKVSEEEGHGLAFWSQGNGGWDGVLAIPNQVFDVKRLLKDG